MASASPSISLPLTETPRHGSLGDYGGGPKLRAAVALIPQRQTLDGPISNARLRRTLLVYLLIAATGFALAFGAPSSSWQAFGLGLVLPGGGFTVLLAGGGWLIFGAVLGLTFSVLLFAAGLFAWFGTGNNLAPPLVWLASAVAAAALAPMQSWSGAPWLLVAAVLALALLTMNRRRLQQRVAVANRERRNIHLAKVAASLSSVTSRELVVEDVNEVPEEAAGFLRYLLDRALQPVGEFNGFDSIDQFQTAAIRYQVCNFGYMLAAVQHQSLPAFRGYLSEAQCRLHSKMLDHRNWKYWALENAWGNLSFNPDPVPRDNIMYSGWFGALLAEYISNTGDQRYNQEPLRLQHPDGREWQYTFSQLAEAVYRNFKRSDFTLFPCEPNWIYPLCNNFGSIALKIHDRLYGTDWWADIEANYRRRFDDEFMTLDGRTLAIRSSRTGLTISALTSVMADCVTAYFLHGVLPDVARRCWEIARLDFIRVAEGQVELVTRGWDAIDTGNYRKSMLTTYAQVGAAAAEMGDYEVLRLLQQRVREEFTRIDAEGVSSISGASNFAHASVLGLYSQTVGTRRKMHEQGVLPSDRDGPLLLQAPYPDVLVTHASNDNGVLQLVLRPGRPQALGGEFALDFGQLVAGSRYRVDGALSEDLVADSLGKLSLRLRLQGRTALRLHRVQ